MTEYLSGPTSRQNRASVRFGTCTSVTGKLQQFKFRAAAGRVGDPAGPENCAKSGSLGGRRNSQNASMDDVRFSPPTRPPLAKRLGNSEKLAASGGGRAVALPACLTMVKHKGNVSRVGITCPSLDALEGPAPAAHAKGFIVQGFRPSKGQDPLCGPHPGDSGAMP